MEIDETVVLARALLIGSALPAVLLISSCDAPTPDTDVPADVLERLAQREREGEEVQRIWRLKEQQGQGCKGEILRDDDLREAVVGKWHTELLPQGLPPRTSRKYELDGIVIAPGEGRNTSGRYRFEGPLLCDQIPEQGGDVDWCYRLIRTADDRIMREILIGTAGSEFEERTLENSELACLEIRVSDQGAVS